MRAAVLALVAAGAAASAGLDPAGFARGAAAVGERPSDAIALREAQARTPASPPSPSFRLGAAYRAWRNATAAIAHDASHPTGDGGDVEVLAEDCSDERIAFIAVEAERAALALTPEQVATTVRLDAAAVTAWQARRTRPADRCRR